MTRFQKMFAILALALCFAGAVGGALWEASHSRHSPSQSRAADQQNGTENKTVRDTTRGRRETQSLWTPTDSIGLYTLVLSVFTAILAIATIGLGVISFFQIRLARAEFVSTHRPHIIVHGLRLEPCEDRRSLQVYFLYTNIGDSPAEITHVATSLSETGIPAVWAPNDIMWRYEKIERPIEIVSGAWRYGLSDDVVGPEKEAAMLVCVGYIRYRDKNGAVRQTGFCRRKMGLGDRWSVLEDPEYEYSY